MIDNISGFINEMFEMNEDYSTGSVAGEGGSITFYTAHLKKDLKGNMYCPKCCRESRMEAYPLYPNNVRDVLNILVSDEISRIEAIMNNLMPTLWNFKCTQCDTIFTVVFYQGANEVQMAVLPSCNGGVVTQNTPPAVAYYLDQAYKAKSVTANSACIAIEVL